MFMESPRSIRRRRGLCLVAMGLMALSFLGGCGTIANLTEGPVVYGGVRGDWHRQESGTAGSSFFNLVDLPFSFVLDTALLPITASFELIRALSGWPGKPEY